MTDDTIQALLEEWKAQRSLLDQYRLISLKVPPVVVALASGFLIYGQGGKGYVGLAVALGVIMLQCWYAFVQLNLDFSGIRSVELEVRINKRLRITNAEGMNWTIEALNEAATKAPGFRCYVAVSGILAALLFLAALLQGLSWLRMRVSLLAALAVGFIIMAMGV